MSRIADWQTCPGPGFINKDFIGLRYGLDVHFLLVVLFLNKGDFSIWKPIFYTDTVQEK